MEPGSFFLFFFFLVAVGSDAILIIDVPFIQWLTYVFLCKEAATMVFPWWPRLTNVTQEKWCRCQPRTTLVASYTHANKLLPRRILRKLELLHSNIRCTIIFWTVIEPDDTFVFVHICEIRTLHCYETLLHSHYFHRCCKHAQGNEKWMGWQEHEQYFFCSGEKEALLIYWLRKKQYTQSAHRVSATRSANAHTYYVFVYIYKQNAERVRARSNIVQLTFRTQSSKSTTIRMRKSQFLTNETRVLWSAFSMSTPLMDKITSPGDTHTQDNN